MTLFGQEVQTEQLPPADPIAAMTIGPPSRMRYTLNRDLALWVRDEAAARGQSPDAIVRYAVAKLQQDTVWADA